MPSFLWFMDGRPLKGSGITSMIAIARKVMSRRGVSMSDAEEALIRHVFEMTRNERNQVIRKSWGSD